MARRWGIVAASLLALAGCSDPYGRMVPAGPASRAPEFQRTVRRLPAADQASLDAYLARHAGAAPDAVPPGTTVRAALDEQKAFDLEQRTKAAEAERLRAGRSTRDALAAKGAADRKARARELEAALGVAVTKLAYRKGDLVGGRAVNSLTMDVALRNRSGKGIAGVKGVLRLRDVSGALVSSTPIAVARIAPGKTLVWSDERHYRQSDDSDKKLAGAALDKLKVEWAPAVIAFQDGRKLTAPE